MHDLGKAVVEAHRLHEHLVEVAGRRRRGRVREHREHYRREQSPAGVACEGRNPRGKRAGESRRSAAVVAGRRQIHPEPTARLQARSGVDGNGDGVDQSQLLRETRATQREGEASPHPITGGGAGGFGSGGQRIKQW